MLNVVENSKQLEIFTNPLAPRLIQDIVVLILLFLLVVVNDWNELPTEVVEQTVLNGLKNSIILCIQLKL
ncbi:hypothetical protein BpHYR1_043502 [Brachionus plicatilis]|uniref:Uncharacterized protein n=1 Tax=Brachionus plicatilis TaxID=10195 RepID=A0A3M7PS21_BRAPC|nr:hypothetical protein BpHYR1_043502 [Brachionus plicatilis]